MDDEAVKLAAAREAREVADGLRRLVGEEAPGDVAGVGVQHRAGLARRLLKIPGVFGAPRRWAVGLLDAVGERAARELAERVPDRLPRVGVRVLAARGVLAREQRDARG